MPSVSFLFTTIGPLTIQVPIMDTMDIHQDDLELHDFIDDPNFDQFISLLRGENEDAIYNLDSDIFNGFIFDNQFLPCPPNPLDQGNSNSLNVNDPSSTLSSFSCFDGEVKGRGREEDDGEDSSATTTTTIATTSVNAKPKPKTDRSKTLISERKRRGRMKDKLYALRSLVPNITKMDKASIIGDAVSYVHELQAHANKLKAEVAGLEASLLVSENDHGSIQNPIEVQFTSNNLPICKKIIQILDMFQVDERGFYVKVVCNKGEGVASSLYRSLESMAGFNIVQSSNLATISDHSFLLTFLLNVKGSEPTINLPNLKLWLAGAFLNQGFEFIPSFKL